MAWFGLLIWRRGWLVVVVIWDESGNYHGERGGQWKVGKEKPRSLHVLFCFFCFLSLPVSAIRHMHGVAKRYHWNWDGIRGNQRGCMLFIFVLLGGFNFHFLVSESSYLFIFYPWTSFSPAVFLFFFFLFAVRSTTNHDALTQTHAQRHWSKRVVSFFFLSFWGFFLILMVRNELMSFSSQTERILSLFLSPLSLVWFSWCII